MEEKIEKEKGITHLVVSGYKSISQECGIDIAPLTILAGANSSGKSSIMQPFLLIKQTLEAPFDPGALLLNGPNVKFTESSQLLSRCTTGRRNPRFSIGICVDKRHLVTVQFFRQRSVGFKVEKMISGVYKKITLKEGMSHEKIQNILPKVVRKNIDKFFKKVDGFELAIERERSFLNVVARNPTLTDDSSFHIYVTSPAGGAQDCIISMIHLPGLRGLPVRSYPVTAVGSLFPGTFETYTASIIAKWQSEDKDEKLSELRQNLKRLHLASHIEAQPINDTQVELRVNRSHRDDNGALDTVNIADTGVGVSQALPILVALLAADPGQLVYIEQPEIHLHPKAQIAMAEILANAAKKGVKVVIETHSALLILAVQTLVAEGALSPDLVKLHWFTRQDGVTCVSTTDLDRAGAFTEDWPEDFGNIEMHIQNRYLSASEAVQIGEKLE